MSGGSYNYLCYSHDIEILIEKLPYLGAMCERLKELGDTKAYRDTRKLYNRLMEINEWLYSDEGSALKDVWRNVEWRDSGDYSDEDMEEAIREYEKLA